jgi:RNA polymerase sigma factor (sigma-70 family)
LTVTQPPSGAAILPREFERIFREHYEFVYRTARHITGNPQDAEDVVQTLFLRLLGRELAGDVTANPRGYLYRAAVNIALDVLRARKRRAYTEDDPELLAAGGEAQAFATLRDVLTELHPKSAEILVCITFTGTPTRRSQSCWALLRERSLSACFVRGRGCANRCAGRGRRRNESGKANRRILGEGTP